MSLSIQKVEFIMSPSADWAQLWGGFPPCRVEVMKLICLAPTFFLTAAGTQPEETVVLLQKILSSILGNVVYDQGLLEAWESL